MKHLYRLFILLLAVITLPSMAIGQRTITGTVTDGESGEPLISVNVVVAGTTNGTVTDFDGKYSIELKEGESQLTFSYIGYTEQTLDVGEGDVIDVKLSSGELLEEVIVIGYGEVKRSDATGSIAKVGNESFNKGAITSPQELFSGKVAGVAVTAGGAPGSGAAIRIRAGSSLNASNDPLIVVDGVPISNDGGSGSRNFLNFVNPNDIEDVTVLKDASATAIYGSRASNGVILITTKKGKTGAPMRIDYLGNMSFGQIAKRLDVMDADEFRSYITNTFGEGSTQAQMLGDANTDWQDEVYNTWARGFEHNLTFSGAVKKLPYRVAFGYNEKVGLLKTDQFDRTTASVNLNPNFLDNMLQFNLNFKAMNTKNYFADNGAIGNAASFDPTQSTRSGNSDYDGWFTWLQTDGSGLPNTIAPTNPLASLNLVDNRSEVNRYVINGSVDYRFWFLKELRANLNLGYDVTQGGGTVSVPTYAPWEATQAANLQGTESVYNSENTNKLLEFYLNYAKTFGKTKFALMGGYSYQDFERYSDNVTRSASGEVKPGAEYDEYRDRNNLQSFFGRLELGFNDFVFLTGTVRADGSSRFSEENRWGIFPAAAVALKLVEKEGAGLNNLKLRAGWGVTGQQDIGSLYPYLATYLTSTSTAQYQLGDVFYNTIRPGGYDAGIKWEETTTLNAGVDFGLFNNKLTGALEVYQRETQDLLAFVPVAAGTNLTNALTTNIGSLTNQGVELTLNADIINKNEFSWSLGGNIAYNENEITKLQASDDPTYQGIAWGGISGGVGNTIQIQTVGHPAYSYFVYEQVYDANGTPIEGLYVDRNEDGQITPEDRYRYQDAQGDINIGVTTNLLYKGFDLSAAGRGLYGGAYLYNNVLSDKGFEQASYGPGVLRNVYQSTPEIGFEGANYFSDHYIQEASFFRIDHITLGYTFDVKKRLKSVRFYTSVQNPTIFTNYIGIDPEVFGGIDNNVYPRPRTYLFGLNASF